MRNKLFLWLGVALLIIVGLLLITKTGTKGTAIKTDQISDPQIKQIVEAYKPEEPYQDTSIDKIQSAFDAGKITLEQNLLYQIAAISNPEKLPKEFKGAPDSTDNAYLFGLINEKWDTLAQTTRDALLPFLLPPDDPKSYYNPTLGTAEEKNIWDKLIQEALAAPAVVWIETKPLATVSVYYQKSREQQDYHNSVWTQTAAVDATPKFSNLLGVDLSDKKINIYLNNRGLSGYGEAYLSPVSNKICMINIKTGLDEKMTKTTAAHEIFHCYQYFYGLKYEKSTMKWLMEATATWSEDFIYHDYNSEHEYDTSFFNHTNWDLLSIKNQHQYASYLWFYYLMEKTGGGQETALALAKAKQTGEARDALKSRGNLNEELKEFSFWNWNQVPFLYHNDSPQFPAITPNGSSLKMIPVGSLGDKTEPVSLEKGGAKYYFYYITNDNIKKLTFDVQAFGINENNQKGLQALIKIGDNWYYEDWSGINERTFCRNIDDEDITAAVLITTNSNVGSTTTGNLKIKAEKKCNPGWIGTVRVSWQGEYEDWGKASGHVKVAGSYSFNEELEYDPQNDELLVKKHNFTANEKYAKTYQGGKWGCGVIFENSFATTSGNGNYIYNLKNEDEHQVRMYGTTHAEDTTGKLGGTYSIGFNIASDPNPKGAEKQFKTQSHWEYLEKNCSLILDLQNAWGGYEENSNTEYSSSISPNPNSIDITIKPTDKIIKGHSTFEPGDNIKGTIDWEYKKMD